MAIDDLDFEDMEKKISNPMLKNKGEKLSKGMSASYGHLQKAAGHNQYSKKEKEEMGVDPSVELYKAAPLKDKKKAEDITDKLGLHFARGMNPLVAKRLEDIKSKLKEKQYKSSDEKKDLEDELNLVRSELKHMGFDWESTYDDVSTKGLTEDLKNRLTQAIGAYYPEYVIGRKHMDKIKQEHLPKLAEYIGKMDGKFDVDYLKSRQIQEVKDVLRGVANIKRQYKPNETDLLKEHMKKDLGHYFKDRYGTAEKKVA